MSERDSEFEKEIIHKVYTDAYSKLVLNNQFQLLQFYKELSFNEKAQLLYEINTTDLEELCQRFYQAKSFSKEKRDILPLKILPDFYDSKRQSPTSMIEMYRKIGLKKIAEGRICALAYSDCNLINKDAIVGLHIPEIPSKKTLFQLQAEKLLTLCQLSREVKTESKKKCDIPWYILVSKPNEYTVKNYFEENNYFGLNRNSVKFCIQELYPVFDYEAKIMLNEKYSILRETMGSGTMFKILEQTGAIKEMYRSGIEYIFVYNTNNILVKIADPVFIGYAVSREADYAVKVVDRLNEDQWVNLLCSCDKYIHTIIWNEMPATRDDKQMDGLFYFDKVDAGMYLIKMQLTEKVLENLDLLPIHPVRVKNHIYNKRGKRIESSIFNGIYLEQFVFDIMKLSRALMVWQVDAVHEYCPIILKTYKRKETNDLRNFFEYQRYLITKNGGQCGSVVEVSPLLSYDGEKLDSIVKNNVYKDGDVLEIDKSDPFLRKLFKSFIPRRYSIHNDYLTQIEMVYTPQRPSILKANNKYATEKKRTSMEEKLTSSLKLPNATPRQSRTSTKRVSIKPEASYDKAGTSRQSRTFSQSSFNAPSALMITKSNSKSSHLSNVSFNTDTTTRTRQSSISSETAKSKRKNSNSNIPSTSSLNPKLQPASGSGISQASRRRQHNLSNDSVNRSQVNKQ